MKMKALISSLGLAAPLLAFAIPALAAVELETRAYREVEVASADGEKAKNLEPLERAAPGQEVVYVITYRNSSDEAAQGLVVNNKVPAEMVFVAASARGANATAEVSVDGRTFGQLASLRVKNSDGSQRRALAADVTALRWTVQGAVAPGASGSVSYRAVLK